MPSPHLITLLTLVHCGLVAPLYFAEKVACVHFGFVFAVSESADHSEADWGTGGRSRNILPTLRQKNGEQQSARKLA